MGRTVAQLSWTFQSVIGEHLPPSGVKIGTVLPEVASATGLPTSCVVATGGHDHLCGALVIGVNRPARCSIHWVLPRPCFCPSTTHLTIDSGEQGYTQGAHVAGGYYMLGGLFTSSASIEWLRDVVAPNCRLCRADCRS